MATNTTEIELVEFKATGLDAIAEGTERFSNDLDAARKRAGELADKLNHPAYRRHLDSMAQMNRQYKQLAAQQEKMQKQAEWDAKSRWEKMAGFRAGAMKLGGMGVAAGFGLAAKGMSGSAEMAVLDMRIQSLARSISGMAIPAVEGLTSVAEGLERVTRKMTGRQQEAVGLIATFAALGYAVGGPKGAAAGGLVAGSISVGQWIGDKIAGNNDPKRRESTPYNPGMAEVGAAYEDIFQKGQSLGVVNNDPLSRLATSVENIWERICSITERPGM